MPLLGILKKYTVANWLPKFDCILFSALGPIQGNKVRHLFKLVVAWGRLKIFFSISALTPSGRPWG
jgi:hypothetical protein